MDQRYLFALGGVLVGGFLVLSWPKTQPAQLEMIQEDQNAFQRSDFTSVPLNGFGGAGGDMPPHEYTRTEYIYTGDITLPSGTVQVVQRLNPTNKPSATAIPKGFADAILNWSQLSSTQLTNVTVEEPSHSGYSVTIDFNQGMVNMYKKISAAERPDMYCSGEDCYRQNRLQESDMLPNEEVLRIAQDFATEYGFDLTQYADPVVQDDWRMWQAASTTPEDFYFPDQISVVFPLLINGTPVYEEYGMPHGMTMSVDVRLGVVASVFNYYASDYQERTYDAFTDAEKAAEVVKFGSLYSWVDEQADVVEATLSEPTEAYMSYFRWDQETQQSTNLFVPALVFPIENVPEGTMEHRRTIVLPLVQEVYDNMSAMEPMPMPMEPFDAPAIEPAAAG